MNILISLLNLNLGGPTKFLLRLAKELSKENNIYIYDFYPYINDIDVNSREYAGINFISIKDKKTDWINWKVNGLLKKVTGKENYWETIRNKHFEKCIKKNKIQIILSTQKKIDHIVGPIAKKNKIPFLIRLNSDYAINSKNIKELTTSKEIMNNLSGIIYTADYHFNNLKNKLSLSSDIKEMKIMNGIEYPANDYHKPKKFPSSIDKDCTIFGMVARGIKEKGWEECILAFLKTLNENKKENIHLILVGGGEYLEHLKTKYRHNKVHFIGKSDKPIEWIQQFDICLLPTYFNNESTPNSLIEYLACEKPVISTDYVEIPYMMSTNNKYAGRIVKLKNNKPDFEDISMEMSHYLKNKSQITEDGKLAKLAAKKFNIKVCSKLYLDFFYNFIK